MLLQSKFSHSWSAESTHLFVLLIVVDLRFRKITTDRPARTGVYRATATKRVRTVRLATSKRASASAERGLSGVAAKRVRTGLRK